MRVRGPIAPRFWLTERFSDVQSNDPRTALSHADMSWQKSATNFYIIKSPDFTKSRAIRHQTFVRSFPTHPKEFQRPAHIIVILARYCTAANVYQWKKTLRVSSMQCHKNKWKNGMFLGRHNLLRRISYNRPCSILIFLNNIILQAKLSNSELS